MQHQADFLKIVEECRAQIKELSIDQVKAKLDKAEHFSFIDVREDSEWAANQLPQAIHIGRGVLERDIANLGLGKSAEIILYCGGGFRSALAAYNLQKMGYSNVYSMDGGVRDWIAQGYELVSR